LGLSRLVDLIEIRSHNIYQWGKIGKA